MNKGVIYALLAAALFGISTPFAKTMVADIAPVMLAGVLYMSSGLGLLLIFILRFIIFRNQQD
ncbi:MAG: EamA family transporter, partial [Burkholderiales bacterium]|nr:EamA family transporter [Burkholderiales bacterium]